MERSRIIDTTSEKPHWLKHEIIERGGIVMAQDIDIAEQFERHLNSPKQTWLLGAGISFGANIPLMYPLTARVLHLARNEEFTQDALAIQVLDFVIGDCGDKSHIEHHLTHLGDLISIAERSYTGGIVIAGHQIASEKLIEVHQALLRHIAETVRWGFKAARNDENAVIIEEEKIGTAECSVVDVSGHCKFISAIFGSSRAGLDFVRTPVEFFTTNYDTLLEDALALSGIEFQDGFIGGGVGFWNMKNYASRDGTRAMVSKLHGSIDWYRSNERHENLLRVRHGDTYPKKSGSVMIYPQATKYLNTQRDPFAEIFQRFRQRLSLGSDHVLMVCGYSFGDDHINAEIEIAMSSQKSQLTVVAFVDEPSNALPPTLDAWLTRPWSQRLFIASPNGIYQGGAGPVFSAPQGKRDWWTFDGVANLFSAGLPKDIQEAMA